MSRPLCQGTTRSGHRCHGTRVQGSYFCWNHREQTPPELNMVEEPVTPEQRSPLQPFENEDLVLNRTRRRIYTSSPIDLYPTFENVHFDDNSMSMPDDDMLQSPSGGRVSGFFNDNNSEHTVNDITIPDSQDNFECPVCLDDIASDKCVKLPCNHVFCFLCAIKVHNRRCPMCRQPF